MTDAPTQRVAGAPGATPGVTVGLSGSVGVAELKQRKVLRVAATYAVIAWLLIQASAMVSTALKLPEWMVTSTTVLLILGFPVAPVLAWAGCFGASASGLPAIGAIPGAAPCFAVMGYGGNGITFSVIAAQMIQRAILGLPDPDAELFAMP